MLDYYAILEIPPTADPEAVKTAYRRMALRYHPDVNPAPEAVERIKLVNEAYGVLNDHTRRHMYNLRREAYIQRLRQDEQRRTAGPVNANGVRNASSSAPYGGMPFPKGVRYNAPPPGFRPHGARQHYRPGPGRPAAKSPNEDFTLQGVGRAVGGGCLTIIVLTIAVWVGIGLSEIFLWLTGMDDIGHIRLFFALGTLVSTIVVLLKYIAKRYDKRGVE